MVIKRFQDKIMGTVSKQRNGSSSEDNNALPEGDTPEANATRGVRLFCESGGPENSGDEVLHLPVIVESAESSPAAATAAAHQIRKFLSKENFGRPHVQYNAIMLIRILADNPGPSFTRNLDAKFSGTMKQLLRESKDQSVQQIARETLSALYQEKAYDTNLSTVFSMWTKEMPGQIRPPPGPRTMNAPPFNPATQGWPQAQYPPNGAMPGSRSYGSGLPPPSELAARVEEAKTSAKLLQQLVQSTPPGELQTNDLIKEFGQRVSAAQRSIQGYINCDNPPPDADTLQTLIETSEQLSLAASKHQRAVLQSRRLAGPSPTPPPPQAPPPEGETQYAGTAAPRTSAPILSQPALPVRTGSNGLPQTQPLWRTKTPPAAQPQPTTFIAPAGPPGGQGSPETATTNDSDYDTLYNPPPPPASMQANLARRQDRQASLNSTPNASAMLPPVTVNSQPIELDVSTAAPPSQQSGSSRRPLPAAATPPAAAADDPFSDAHRSAAANGGEQEPRAGAPATYQPRYRSTPGYARGRDGSGDRFAMSGGRESPAAARAEDEDEEDEDDDEGSAGRSARNVSPLYERARERGGGSGSGYRY